MAKMNKGMLKLLEGALGPDDSVSVMSQRDSSKASSKASSATSAYIKAKAEQAALRAKAQALEMKHALDMEEVQRKARKENKSLP